MNVFDALVVGFTLLAVVMGCRTGLLRSLATIVAYIIAAPVALVVAPKLTAYAPDRGDLLFFVVFAVAGMAIGVLLSGAIVGAAAVWTIDRASTNGSSATENGVGRRCRTGRA